MADKVILLDTWASCFSQRARIALAEKGVEYECKEEENLRTNKSQILLEMNPVKKQIPVLIHNGKPVCESLIIVQYIDEVWDNKPHLLPSDPYQRAQARFWADFVDKKIYILGRTGLFSTEQDHDDGTKKELVECYKLLEGELGDKTYFGGEELGLVDVALIPFFSWFYAYEQWGLNMVEECPQIVAWAKRCMQKESVSKSLPDPHKVYDLFMEYKKR